MAEAESGEALERMAEALYLEREYAEAAAHYERAYGAYRRERRSMAAGRAARAVAWITGNVFGEWAVQSGWFARAGTILEEAGHDRPEHGWVLIMRAYAEPDAQARETLLGQAVACLSGRTAIYRRSLLLEIEPEFMEESFWGVPCLSGDDKRLTTLVLEHGYLTYMQRTAVVWSTFPDKWSIFFKQRLRWARNTWRSDLRALGNRWVYRHPFLAFTMMDKAISSFTLLLGPTFLGYAITQQKWAFVVVLVAWWQISRSAKLLPHLRRRPSSFFFVLGYVVVSWVMALIKLYALFSIRKQRWLTRQVAVENGAVVRTATPQPVPAPTSPPVPVGAARW